MSKQNRIFKVQFCWPQVRISRRRLTRTYMPSLASWLRLEKVVVKEIEKGGTEVELTDAKVVL